MAVYCSTDLELDPIQVFEMFKERFQIEFLIRDAIQFTGLEHCQARSEEKITYACQIWPSLLLE